VFAHQESRGSVEIAFTDRHGGTSGGPFASLNLSTQSADEPGAVSSNLTLLADAFARGAGVRRVVLMNQVHGADVHVVDEANLDGPAPSVDALVTKLPGVVLVARAADCVPVLLADAAGGVVAAVHAGRPGLVAGVVPRAVEVMRDLGAEAVEAWLGPHVCGKCYEVPESMRAEVAAAAPESFAETSWGTPAVDIGAGLMAQLARDGVPAKDVGRCTIEDEDLYSYRRQGEESGRLGGLVWLRP
jgi:purine-nucleoside/S-methyl-5'-thioadenosine phosphorylase / adenosine deaminase